MNLRAKEIVDGKGFADAVFLSMVMCSAITAKKVGKIYFIAKNRAVKGTTDYWVNLADGTPILCLPKSFNQRLNTNLLRVNSHFGSLLLHNYRF